jgi:adenylate cyclase
MANEVELKLSLPAGAQRALLRHPLLRAALERKRETLDNIYYDTPELALQRHGVALRVRRQGRLWLQTVKCAGISAGGLSARPEWEIPYTGRFNFIGIDDDEVRKWLRRPKIVESLAPVFETRFSRITWRIETNDSAEGGSVLVTLDRGWIAASGRREEISEMEIELVAGHPGTLLALADTLAQRLPLVPAVRSKAERGYRLHAGMPLAPIKAMTIDIDAAMPPVIAFRNIAHGCLEQLQLNYAGAVDSDDPEFIHQMRVACRRLRAALRLFAPVLPDAFDERWLPGLRAVMCRLGRLRDLDVLQAEILGPVQCALAAEPRLMALAGRITEQRHEARRDVLETLHGADYRLLLLAMMGALQQAPFGVTATGAVAGEKLGDESDPLTVARFATRRVHRLHAKVIALAKLAKRDDPASLHRLRIGIKRLRYGLEFFAPLMAAKPLRHSLRRLTDLQDRLGQLNDLASAGNFLMHCAGAESALREAVALVGGWHGSRHVELLNVVERLVEKLPQIRLPKIAARQLALNKLV